MVWLRRDLPLLRRVTTDLVDIGVGRARTSAAPCLVGRVHACVPAPYATLICSSDARVASVNKGEKRAMIRRMQSLD
jgi:hypothetical protein